MRRLTTLLVLAVVVMATFVPSAPAQIVPAPPAPIAPPPELRPLLDLLGPPGTALTEPACATLGTLLGLGVVVVPGLPTTVETVTAIPLGGLPIDGRAELGAAVDLLLFVEGSGCGLLPLAAERTVCAADDGLLSPLRLPDLPVESTGVPLDPGDFVPILPPPAGTVVDTFGVLATIGVPGAREVADALDAVGDCGLRARFTAFGIPPAAPADPALPTIPPAPAVGGSHQPASPSAGPVGRVAPRSAVPAPRSAVPRASFAPRQVTGASRAAPDPAPGWLAGLVAVALAALVHRALAPRRGGLH
jgi:hypothetical protein